LENSIALHCGDCRELSKTIIEPESIDLIFTDPPYIKKYLYLYQWIVAESVRALKPEGFCLIYCGSYWKNEIFKYFDGEMEYFWDFVIMNRGYSSIQWQRKIISRYKSLLAFRKPGSKAKPRCNVLSLWKGGGEDKRFHTWGQDESSARYYIDSFSKEDDLVVDYFLGGGTTGEICKKLNRNFIGFENDEAAFEIANDRINGTNRINNKKSEQFHLAI
jgi:site-specific DNA-methyltransferase (adenine-specific)